MRSESMTVALRREPVEVSILVDGGHETGPFIANRQRRGLELSDGPNRLCLTAADGLMLLGWLRDHEAHLQALIEEERAAIETVERRFIEHSPEMPLD